MTTGHLVALSAHGVIGAWQTYECIILSATCPAAIVCYRCGAGLLSIGYVFIVSAALINIGRVYFTRKLLGFSIRYWIRRVCLPLTLVLGLGMSIGKFVTVWVGPSFLRLFCTSLISMASVSIVGWVCIFEDEEREFLLKRFRTLIPRPFKA